MSRTRLCVRFLTSATLLTSVLAHSALAQTARTGSAAKPPAATPMQRADTLLAKMTIEEKAMQLSSVFPLALFDTTGTNQAQLDALLKNGIGHVSALGLIGRRFSGKSRNAIRWRDAEPLRQQRRSE